MTMMIMTMALVQCSIVVAGGSGGNKVDTLRPSTHTRRDDDDHHDHDDDHEDDDHDDNETPPIYTGRQR